MVHVPPFFVFLFVPHFGQRAPLLLCAPLIFRNLRSAPVLSLYIFLPASVWSRTFVWMGGGRHLSRGR